MSRRGENIYKRKDGRYEGRFLIVRDECGKAKYGSVYAKTYTEIKIKLLAAKQGGMAYKIPSQLTVAEWFSEYVGIIGQSVKITALNVYEGYCKNHITPYFMTMRLCTLTRDILQSFVTSLNAKKLSPYTVQSVFTFTRDGLKEAHSRGFTGIVWENICLPKAVRREMRVFTLAEQTKIERVILDSDNANDFGIFLCLYTGLRIGELCALHWSDISFEDGTLYINHTLVRTSVDGVSRLMELPPKSDSSARCIPLPQFVLHRLRLHKEKTQNGQYVINRFGKHIEPRSYRYRFEQILKIADVPHANFHTTRHTFATRALEMGFDVKTLSEILGHSSVTITLNRYAHSLDDYKRSRMELLKNIGNNSSNNRQ